MNRALLRKKYLQLRDGLDLRTREKADASIAVHLRCWLATLELPQAANPILALWWPVGSEPDLRPYFAGFRALGWTLALPCVIARACALRFARYDADTTLRQAAFGIHEPACPHWVEPSALAAPCVGFWDGYRLGYGGGYYDRTLAEDVGLASRSVAVAYRQSRIAAEDGFVALPLDQRFSAVITEVGTKYSSKALSLPTPDPE